MTTLKPQFVDVIAEMHSQYPGSGFDSLINALTDTEPSVGIRVNPLKGVEVKGLRPVTWADGGYYVDGDRPRFTFDPAMHQGLYYVQDPSSMVITRIVSFLASSMGNRPLIYVDACAAPGGKTTAAMSALPQGSLVIANEYDRHRCESLRENVIKWGHPAVIVTYGDTSRLNVKGLQADIIAVDAPCSGEGMMRKDDTAVTQWSPALVDQCASLQREILTNLWPVLRPGGYLIYSTCTFNTAEDEDNLRFIVDRLGGEPVVPPLEAENGIRGAVTGLYPALRFMPGSVDGEGLFIAVVRKPGDVDEPAAAKPQKPQKQAKPDPLLAKAAEWIANPSAFNLSIEGDTVVATPAAHRQLIADLTGRLKPLYRATEIATVKGRDLIPSQALAMSTILRSDAFPTVEVDYSTAIAYLRREAVTLSDAPRGIVLLTYGSRPLGFVKNLGNRANNLYPQQWAIRSTHTPDISPQII